MGEQWIVQDDLHLPLQTLLHLPAQRGPEVETPLLWAGLGQGEAPQGEPRRARLPPCPVTRGHSVC